MLNPVSFVSLGAGDPDLLTVKALNILRGADVIIVPATVSINGSSKSRALDIIRRYDVKADIREYNVPMKHDRKAALAVYDLIYDDIRQLYSIGKNIAVGVEGDVSIYASIHYVMDRLSANGILVEQLAGIPSFIASAAVAHLSLVSNSQRMIVIPGDVTLDEIEQWKANDYRIVIMKLSQCKEIIKAYFMHNPAARCYYFENVGTEAEFFTTDVEAILSRKIPYFSQLII